MIQLQLQLAAAFGVLVVGLFFGFAASDSYGEMIAASALLHTASIIMFLVISKAPGSGASGRSLSRWLVGLGIAVNLVFLVELAARYFFRMRVLFP